jgi:hypothetical protein
MSDDHNLIERHDFSSPVALRAEDSGLDAELLFFLTRHPTRLLMRRTSAATASIINSTYTIPVILRIIRVSAYILIIIRFCAQQEHVSAPLFRVELPVYLGRAYQVAKQWSQLLLMPSIDVRRERNRQAYQAAFWLPSAPRIGTPSENIVLRSADDKIREILSIWILN